MGNGAYWVGVSFWVFVGAVSIAGIIGEHKKRRLGVDLLRAMIDKGQPLDPLLVEKVMSQRRQDDGINPMDLKLGGIIVAAVGIGLFPLAYFFGKFEPVTFYPILGAAAVTVCVGVGLLIGAKAVAGARNEQSVPTPL